MKVIHLVLGKANPERMNGVNKVVHKLASVQYEQGSDVEVWGLSNDLEHNYPERNFTTRLFLQHRLQGFLDRKLVAAIGQLKRPAIFHLHGAFIPTFYSVHRQLVKRSLPYVMTPHGALAPGAMQQSPYLKAFYLRLFERSLLRRARVVQLLGWSGFENAARLAPQCQRILIPNGQDLRELPELPAPDNACVHFVFCGRLDRYHKGLDLFLEGFAQFQRAGGKGRVGLIGNGKDRAFLERLVGQLDIGAAVEFYGARFGAEKFQFIRRGDVFFHTSRMEGFPMAVLEAAGMGLPCLVSEATNMGSYIGDYRAGRVLMENTASAIAEALGRLEQAHRNGQLSRMGKNARLMVTEQFNWEDIARRLYEVYTENNKVDQPMPSLS